MNAVPTPPGVRANITTEDDRCREQCPDALVDGPWPQVRDVALCGHDAVWLCEEREPYEQPVMRRLGTLSHGLEHVGDGVKFHRAVAALRAASFPAGA